MSNFVSTRQKAKQDRDTAMQDRAKIQQELSRLEKVAQTERQSRTELVENFAQAEAQSRQQLEDLVQSEARCQQELADLRDDNESLSIELDAVRADLEHIKGLKFVESSTGAKPGRDASAMAAERIKEIDGELYGDGLAGLKTFHISSLAFLAAGAKTSEWVEICLLCRRMHVCTQEAVEDPTVPPACFLSPSLIIF